MIPVRAQNGEGANEGGAVVMVGDVFQRSLQPTVGSEGVNESFEVTSFVNRNHPEHVRGVTLQAQAIESGIWEQDGEEGVGKNFQNPRGVDRAGMSGMVEGEVALALEVQDQLGEKGGVQV